MPLNDLRRAATSTSPITDSRLIGEVVDFQRIIADYRKTMDIGTLRYRMAQLESSQRMLESNERTAASLQETIGKNGRAAAAAAVSRKNNIESNLTAIATKRAEFDSRVFNQAYGAFEASGKGAAGAQAAAQTLFRTMQQQNVNYNQVNPNTASLANQFVSMVMPGTTLTEVYSDPAKVEALVKMAGGESPALQQQVRNFLTIGAQSDAATREAQQALQNDLAEIGKLPGMAWATGDNPPPQEVQQKITDLSRRIDEKFQFLVGQSLPEVQGQLEAARAEDSEYRRLLDREAMLNEYVFGETRRKENEPTLGRIIAQPIFQEWAKSNGLNIGTATVNADGTVTYAPGGDDLKALLRFQYQMKHPDRSGARLFFDRTGSTGTVAEITVTDPAERERQLARLAYDNGNLVGIERDGKMTYLTKDQYEKGVAASGSEPTGYQYAEGGYLRDPYGNVYQVGQDGETSRVTTPPEGLSFRDAVIYADGKPARYMTVNDFETPETLADAGKYGGADTTESTTLKTQSPYRRIPPDQARDIGTMTYLGTIDKMHANTMLKHGAGAVSINGGQRVFTADQKPFIREIVRKDGTKFSDAGSVLREVHAETLANQYGKDDPRALSVAENRAVMEGVVPSVPESVGIMTQPMEGAAVSATMTSQRTLAPDLALSAARGPGAESRLSMLEAQRLSTPALSEAAATQAAAEKAPAAAAPTPAAPAAPAAPTTPAATAAPSAAGTATPSVAPGAAAAPAAAPATYVRSKDGYVFKVTGPEGERTLEVVAGAKGAPIPRNPVFKPGDPRIAKLDMAGAELVDYDPTKGTVTPKAAPTTTPAPEPAAPAPAEAPKPSKVEGAGPEAAELTERYGVVTQPTDVVRPTLASRIVGGFREALRGDAAGKEEMDLGAVLRQRREAKREEERAAMRGEARAEADRQAERFEKQQATTAPSTMTTEGQRAMQRGMSLAMNDIAERERAGTITKAQADTERQRLMRPTPSAAPMQRPTLAEVEADKAAYEERQRKEQERRDYIKSVSTYVSPEEAARGRAAMAAQAAPAEMPDMGAFLPRKSMAEQVAGQSIGKPTTAPPGPKAPGVKPPATEAETMTPAQKARAALAPKATPPLGKKPEGVIPKAAPAAPSTEGAAPKRPATAELGSRPTPDMGLTEEESGYKTGQVIKQATGKPLEAYRSLAQDFPSMRPVNGTPEEMRRYTRDNVTYYNREK